MIEEIKKDKCVHCRKEIEWFEHCTLKINGEEIGPVCYKCGGRAMRGKANPILYRKF